MRRLLVLVLALGALAAGADRVLVAVAARVVAEQVQRSQGLTERPDIEIHGFPFLTQALRGRYERIDVTAPGVRAESVPLDRVSVRLTGVSVSLGDVVGGEVGSVPVERADATAMIAYAALDAVTRPRGFTVRPVAGRLLVTGRVEVLGRAASASAVASVRVVPGALEFTSKEVRVGNEIANDALSAAVRDRFHFRVSTRGLPFGLRVRSVAVRAGGVVVTADAAGIVLSG